MASTDPLVRLRAGVVIPALPLALDARRRWDERSQRALIRYYLAAGAGGLAVGVHSTQFAIRLPKHGLYRPILELAAETAARSGSPRGCLIAGVIGRTRQAVAEASLARGCGYHAVLLGLGAWAGESEAATLAHCREVARCLPLVGFYLQEAAGGRVLSYDFWRRFAEIPSVVAIKLAPFNRYRTIDVVRAVIEAGRDDIALYTGNDDHIIGDLLTRFNFGGKSRWIDGGLLGQWGVWTSRAVKLLERIKRERTARTIDPRWMQRDAQLTDANSAVFDAAHGFHGCIPGIHEVLRRQGLLRTNACLDPQERLSPGQARELDRVSRAYPWLTDDAFVAANLDRWRS